MTAQVTQARRRTFRERIVFLWLYRRISLLLMLAVVIAMLSIYTGRMFFGWSIDGWPMFLAGVTNVVLGVVCFRDYREGVRDLPEFMINPVVPWFFIVVGTVQVLVYLPI